MSTENEKTQEISFGTPRYIRCPDCGEQIMMAPVLSQMIEIIENHLSTHKVPQCQTLKPELNLQSPKPYFEENLAGKVLERAAEISDVLGKNQNWISKQ